ncbi:MAG: hypothetical protein JNJ40_12580 [Bacteroidia bacterium]|nr:hypothetical protein [Bacteroidia bacterium]
MKTEIPYLNEWLDLAKTGNFIKAQELYYEKLFAVVIENFKANNINTLSKGGILFSILGYSPEPIILTAKLVEPKKHIIFTSNTKTEGTDYLEKYLQSKYEVIHMKDETFEVIYKTLKEQLILNPSSDLTLDITGGKKSMVAAAAIFGKDYGCRIVYVDFEEYMKDLRKPMPGSEILNIVYNPFKNQPEIYLK